MHRIRKQRGRGFQKLSTAAAELLTSYPWPGNIRQLYHFLEQAGMVHDGAVLDVPVIESFITHLSPSLNTEISTATVTLSSAITSSATVLSVITLPNQPQVLQLPDNQFDLDAWQRAIISGALSKHDNAPVKTAAYLGISRKVLYTLRKRYGLLGPGNTDE
jgi:DNA-binding NtrC family response regulator